MSGLTALLPLVLAAAAPAPAPSVEAAPGRGLWIGAIELCRETVAAARLTPDPIDGAPALYVLLRPEVHPLLERETAARVGRTLALRLDGRTLSEPVVREPIAGGHAQLTGLGPEAAAARRAALGPCRRG
ncbi:MAG TPA: hypothetical protein VD887_01645 [Allosphingosinicella sp.]|nr:hypothetical protein [Allosphingosinicella sp.]